MLVVKLDVELSDTMTIGNLRRLAHGLGLELSIAFEDHDGRSDRSATAVSAHPRVTEPLAPGSDRDELIRVLDAHQWNIVRVAKLIGVSRKTLYSRLERWGIERKKPTKTLTLKPAAA
jgi:transcriptional regulator of acetoin/glycerol metabolism